jgi:hypothetical protein
MSIGRVNAAFRCAAGLRLLLATLRIDDPTVADRI